MLVLVKVVPFAEISSARSGDGNKNWWQLTARYFCILTSSSLFCIKVDIGPATTRLCSPPRITSFNVNSVFLGKLRNWLERLIELNLSGLNSGEITKGILVSPRWFENILKCLHCFIKNKTFKKLTSQYEACQGTNFYPYHIYNNNQDIMMVFVLMVVVGDGCDENWLNVLLYWAFEPCRFNWGKWNVGICWYETRHWHAMARHHRKLD